MGQSESNAAGEWRERFERDGFLSPVLILDESEALARRWRMEQAERSFGDLHDQGHFGEDTPATSDLDPVAVVRQRELDREVRATMGLAER